MGEICSRHHDQCRKQQGIEGGRPAGTEEPQDREIAECIGGFDQGIAYRNRSAASPATASKPEVTHQRNIIVELDGVSA